MTNLVLVNKFSTLPGPPWQTFVQGQASLNATGQSLRFVNYNTTTSEYSNAQLDDYQLLARSQFLWQPPLELTVRARFSHPSGILQGTAGFGFWNDPFMMTGLRKPALPRALWFFYASPPSNIKLDLNTPGYGWKVATIDALRWSFFCLVPFSPLAVPLMNVESLYCTFWPIGQRAIQVSEALVSGIAQDLKAPSISKQTNKGKLNANLMVNWHTYHLKWHKKQVEFRVDDALVLACKTSPRGPLGFVMWLDNQFMVVTPWGKFNTGLLNKADEQWMEIDLLRIDK